MPPKRGSLSTARLRLRRWNDTDLTPYASLCAEGEVMRWINRMGQPTYNYSAPTGFPDRGDHWLNVGPLLGRINFGLALVSDQMRGVKVDLLRHAGRRRVESLTEAAELYFMNVLLLETGDERPGFPELHSAIDLMVPGAPARPEHPGEGAIVLDHDHRVLGNERWFLRVVDVSEAFSGRGYNPNTFEELHLDLRDEVVRAAEGAVHRAAPHRGPHLGERALRALTRLDRCALGAG